MEISRRRLLLAGPACLAAAALPVTLAAAQIESPDRLLSLSRESFAAAIGSGFFTQTPAGAPAVLILTAVRDMTLPSPQAVAPVLDTFALEFYDGGEPLPQETYQFQHAVFGSISFLIVPSGVSAYVAIFNRIKGPVPPPGYTIPVRHPKPAAPAAEAGVAG
jgi:hypothetical protein